MRLAEDRPAEIVYLRTYQIVGLYEYAEDRVEISEFLKDWPELHEFVLDHELDHVRIRREGRPFYLHMKADMDHSLALLRSRELCRQVQEFKNKTKPKGLRLSLWYLLYNLFRGFWGMILGVAWSLSPFYWGFKSLKERLIR